MNRIRLGQSSLLGGLDPTHRHLPYFNCGFKDGDLTRLCHSWPADLHHKVGRAILALCMVEMIIEIPIDEAIFDDLRRSLLSFFDEADDLPGIPKCDAQGRIISLHDIREVILALCTLIERGDSQAEHRARCMASRVLEGFGFRSPNDLIVDGYIDPHMGYETRLLDAHEELVRSAKNATLAREADLLSPEDSDRLITIYDVTSAVVEALCAAWRAAITEDDLGSASIRFWIASEAA